MTKAGDWKTPLGYCERAIAELRKAREEFQAELQNLRELQVSQETLKAELKDTKEQLETIQKTANEFKSRVVTAEKAANDAQTELQNLRQLQSSHASLQEALQATKAELKTDIQGTNTKLQTLKENFAQSFKSIFVKAPDDKKHNATCSSSWETVLSYELNLTAPSYVNVLAHGHGFAKNFNSALDIRIFINGSQFDDGFWGLDITHSPYWQTLVCLFLKYLNSGKHIIEVKYRSRHGDGVNWVHLNYHSILIMLNGS
jgi:cysteinyl-tRNA synthetase